MPKIYELDQHVADLIAAGEVVERPASVVKELVENAIDAGAGIVTVEIAAGGMALIRVTDNGCGIAPEDVKTAFLRHATSKLQGPEGLEAIGTLGFRGEALAAIAAVSRIEFLTRETGADEGVSLRLEAGEIVGMSPAGCPEGTTIFVRDLFFNTPARLKFMKSDRAESSGVASAVLRCALSRPDVSFRFIRDSKTVYHTPGDSRLESCIYSLLGRDFSAGLLTAKTSDESVSVEGFVSAPATVHGNRSYQFFFVNGRPIRSVLLQAALEQAYSNRHPKGRFPSCVLHIATKPCDVDVNVHPAKTEIKFVSDKRVFDGVYYAAMGALDNVQSTSAGAQTGYEETATGHVGERQRELNGKWKTENGKTGKTNLHGGFKSMQADEFRKTYVSELTKAYNSPGSSPTASQQNVPDRTNMRASKPSTDDFKVVGEVLNVYIVVEYNGSVWFIDKHAAHERLCFNALKSGNFKPMSQSLLTPVVCRFGHEEVSLLLENAELLDELGFSVESFGEDKIVVRHIPAEIGIEDTESILSDMCSELRHYGAAKPAQRDNIFKMIACKAAIKAGRASDSYEIETLTARVMSGEVTHCPHGRPVVVEMTKAALDKSFKRI